MSRPGSSGVTRRSSGTATTSPITSARACSRTRRKSVALAVVVEVVDGEHRDHQVPGAVGERVLHPGQPHLLPAEPARVEDHLRARVEPGDPRLGEALPAGDGWSRRCRSRARAPSPGRTGSTAIASLLKLVVARHLGPDQLEVGLRPPLRSGGHPRALSCEREGELMAEHDHRRKANRGRQTIDLTRLALSSGEGRRLELEVDPGDRRARGGEYSLGRRPVDGPARDLAHRLRVRAATAPSRRRSRVRACAASSAPGSPVEVDAREVDQRGRRGRGADAAPTSRRASSTSAPGPTTRSCSRSPSSSSAGPTAPVCARSAASRSTTRPRARTTTRREPDPRWAKLGELQRPRASSRVSHLPRLWPSRRRDSRAPGATSAARTTRPRRRG